MKIDWTNKEERLKYHREKNKEWYDKNKDNRRAQLKAYQKAHPEDNVRRTQKYVAKNKEKVYAYGLRYNRTHRGGYRTYQSVALKKGKEFAITLDEFSAIVILPCVYCGEDSKRIGVDRIDNALGYVKENCAPCCKDCNYMKKNLKVEGFLSHIKKIYLYNETKALQSPS